MFHFIFFLKKNIFFVFTIKLDGDFVATAPSVKPSEDSDNIGIIIGGVVGGVCCLLCVVVVIALVMKSNNSSEPRDVPMKEQGTFSAGLSFVVQ